MSIFSISKFTLTFSLSNFKKTGKAFTVIIYIPGLRVYTSFTGN